MSSSDFDNYGSGDSVDSWGVHVGYQIPNSNFGIGAGYRSSETGSNDVEFFGVSLTFGFGEGSHRREMPGAMALIPDAIAEQ